MNDPFDLDLYRQLSGDSFAELVEAGSVEETRDNNRFTNPNLHRRVYPQSPPEGEVAPREYKLLIANKDSYRLTHIFTHDEDAIDTEIP